MGLVGRPIRIGVGRETGPVQASMKRSERIGILRTTYLVVIVNRTLRRLDARWSHQGGVSNIKARAWRPRHGQYANRVKQVLDRLVANPYGNACDNYRHRAVIRRVLCTGVFRTCLPRWDRMKHARAFYFSLRRATPHPSSKTGRDPANRSRNIEVGFARHRPTVVSQARHPCLRSRP